MNISLLMKRTVMGTFAVSLVMAVCPSAIMEAETLPVSKLLESSKTPVSNCNPTSGLINMAGIQTTESHKSPAMFKTNGPSRVLVNSSVVKEVIIDEDFSKWTEGTQSDPSTVMVTEEQASSLMNYQGEWALFRMYEAGGAGYMDYDNIGGDGPGYIMSPGVDVLEGDTGYWRFSCRVKNVNENNQNQQLQAFIMDGASSSIITASTQPMQYGEWSECEWVGQARSANTEFMAFGWQGEILIDRFKVEKLIFPLSSPVVTGATLQPDCASVNVSWEKVETATSYDIEVYYDSQLVASCVAGDVDNTTVYVNVEGDDTYVVYITARNGEDCSYPGYWSGTLVPESVGTVVAKDATDVDVTGFTANWEMADYASKYLVLPTVTHTAATNDEEFYYLNELFGNVPETADSFSPVQIAPMLGYDGVDLYMSRAGWKIDMGVFLRLMPEMPVLGITNQYAAYGLAGSLISPATDYSVGNGTVKVSGMAVSAMDDVVMLCGFMNASGEIYSSETFEVSTGGTPFEIELTGGQADSNLIIKINETVDGGDMVFFTNLALSTSLSEGETVSVPSETVFAGNVNSARVEVPVNEYNTYSYCVQGYFSSMLMGGISESVTVESPVNVKAVASKAEGFVKAIDGILNIQNPEGKNCVISTLDGKTLFTSTSVNSQISLPRSMYIVRIGESVFKVMN